MEVVFFARSRSEGREGCCACMEWVCGKRSLGMEFVCGKRGCRAWGGCTGNEAFVHGVCVGKGGCNAWGGCTGNKAFVHGACVWGGGL